MPLTKRLLCTALRTEDSTTTTYEDNLPLDPPRNPTSYDELRQRNRDDYQQKQSNPYYRCDTLQCFTNPTHFFFFTSSPPVTIRPIFLYPTPTAHWPPTSIKCRRPSSEHHRRLRHPIPRVAKRRTNTATWCKRGAGVPPSSSE